MRSLGTWIGVALLLGCAGKPAAQQAAAMPDEPPPKGAPQPRVGELPPPPPARASETRDENERRFPINEYQLRRERDQRARMQMTGRVEVRGQAPAQACDGLTPEEKLECPLRDPRAVASVKDLPGGVRVSLKRATMTPDKLQQLFACHINLVTARPQATGACTFLDARTQVEVTARPEGVDVDLERGTEVDRLRQQVRAALAPKREARDRRD